MRSAASSALHDMVAGTFLLQGEFPSVDFNLHAAGGGDEETSAPGALEHEESMARRAAELMRTIHNCGERSVAVVTHGSLLAVLGRAVQWEDVRDVKAWRPAELRSVVVEFVRM